MRTKSIEKAKINSESTAGNASKTMISDEEIQAGANALLEKLKFENPLLAIQIEVNRQITNAKCREYYWKHREERLEYERTRRRRKSCKSK
jgi:hypothetical protein